MDNVDRHVNTDIIKQYTLKLKKNYNVTIIHQVPRSPYCNTLNLGVWCSLQASVEKTHYMRRCNMAALVRTVYKIWETVEMLSVISNVFTKLKNTICANNNGNRGNDLVEEKRDKKDADMKFDFISNAIKLEALEADVNIDSDSDDKLMQDI